MMVLVADDLTGACDSAVQFQMRGARSVVHLDLHLRHDSGSDVYAFTTNTRDVSAKEMEARIRKVASLFQESAPEVVFKKIDSVMRGNPGREIMTALDAFACDVAIITPAFPDLGRRVLRSHLHVDGDSAWRPLDILAMLRDQGLQECTHVEPAGIAAAIREGARYISLDSTCNEDLKSIVEAALRSERRVLWAGSGGLASALAEALFSGGPAQSVRQAGNLPVLFCIGSDHAVTLAQIEALKMSRSTCEMDADRATSDEIGAALARGEHPILRISRDSRPCHCLRDNKHLMGALLLSGGDTASMVCQAVGAQSIEIENQIVAGLPTGVLRGGHFDGLPVATKSGGFGQVNALIQVADFFTCLRASHSRADHGRSFRHRPGDCGEGG